MSKWFGFSPCDGMCLFDTEREARMYAQSAADMYRDDASKSGEWSDEADHVCWGRVVQKMQVTHRTNSPDGSEEITDMALVDVPGEVQ